MAADGQLTVKVLLECLQDAVRRGYGDKKIVVADDNEGNGYHGMFYGITFLPEDVKENLDACYGRGVYDSCETNPDNLVILG